MRPGFWIGVVAAWGVASTAAATDLSSSPEVRVARDGAERALDALERTWVDHGGLEIVTGGASTNRTQSRWGHISLRFVASAPRPIEDLTIEAMALSNSATTLPEVIVKGAFGGFAIAPVVQSLGQLIRSYYFDEKRGYTRTIIPSTADQRRALIGVLRDVAREHTGHDRYYFLTSNCTSYVAWILARAGFAQLDQPVPFKPTLAGLHLRRSFVSPWPEVEGVSAAGLRAPVERAVDFTTTRTLDLQRLVVFRGVALGETFLRAVAELRTRPDLHATEDVYGVKTLDPAFYHADEGRSPGPDEVRRAFAARPLIEAARYNRAALRTSHQTSFCRRAAGQCAYFARAQAAIEAVPL